MRLRNILSEIAFWSIVVGLPLFVGAFVALSFSRGNAHVAAFLVSIAGGTLFAFGFLYAIFAPRSEREIAETEMIIREEPLTPAITQLALQHMRDLDPAKFRKMQRLIREKDTESLLRLAEPERRERAKRAAQRARGTR